MYPAGELRCPTTALVCLVLYTEEVNLQTFVMIKCKTFCGNYLCTKKFILVIGFKNPNIFTFSNSKNECKLYRNL